MPDDDEPAAGRQPAGGPGEARGAQLHVRGEDEVDVRGRFEAAWSQIRQYLVGVLAARGVAEVTAEELVVLPGADEILALLELEQRASSGEFDVIVVVLFTHPLLQLLASTRYFSSGHPLTGLDPNALGAVYRGRAQFREPVLAGAKSGASREAQRRQTIAERKAAELDAKSSSTKPAPSKKNDGKDAK